MKTDSASAMTVILFFVWLFGRIGYQDGIDRGAIRFELPETTTNGVGMGVDFGVQQNWGGIGMRLDGSFYNWARERGDIRLWEEELRGYDEFRDCYGYYGEQYFEGVLVWDEDGLPLDDSGMNWGQQPEEGLGGVDGRRFEFPGIDGGWDSDFMVPSSDSFFSTKDIFPDLQDPDVIRSVNEDFFRITFMAVSDGGGDGDGDGGGSDVEAVDDYSLLYLGNGTQVNAGGGDGGGGGSNEVHEDNVPLLSSVGNGTLPPAMNSSDSDGDHQQFNRWPGSGNHIYPGDDRDIYSPSYYRNRHPTPIIVPGDVVFWCNRDFLKWGEEGSNIVASQVLRIYEPYSGDDLYPLARMTPSDRIRLANGGRVWNKAVKVFRKDEDGEWRCIVSGDEGGWDNFLPLDMYRLRAGSVDANIHPDDYVLRSNLDIWQLYGCVFPLNESDTKMVEAYLDLMSLKGRVVRDIGAADRRRDNFIEHFSPIGDIDVGRFEELKEGGDKMPDLLGYIARKDDGESRSVMWEILKANPSLMSNPQRDVVPDSKQPPMSQQSGGNEGGSLSPLDGPRSSVEDGDLQHAIFDSIQANDDRKPAAIQSPPRRDTRPEPIQPPISQQSGGNESSLLPLSDGTWSDVIEEQHLQRALIESIQDDDRKPAANPTLAETESLNLQQNQAYEGASKATLKQTGIVCDVMKVVVDNCNVISPGLGMDVRGKVKSALSTSTMRADGEDSERIPQPNLGVVVTPPPKGFGSRRFRRTPPPGIRISHTELAARIRGVPSSDLKRKFSDVEVGVADDIRLRHNAMVDQGEDPQPSAIVCHRNFIHPSKRPKLDGTPKPPQPSVAPVPTPYPSHPPPSTPSDPRNPYRFLPTQYIETHSSNHNKRRWDQEDAERRVAQRQAIEREMLEMPAEEHAMALGVNLNLQSSADSSAPSPSPDAICDGDLKPAARNITADGAPNTSPESRRDSYSMNSEEGDMPNNDSVTAYANAAMPGWDEAEVKATMYAGLAQSCYRASRTPFDPVQFAKDHPEKDYPELYRDPQMDDLERRIQRNSRRTEAWRRRIDEELGDDRPSRSAVGSDHESTSATALVRTDEALRLPTPLPSSPSSSEDEGDGHNTPYLSTIDDAARAGCRKCIGEMKTGLVDAEENHDICCPRVSKPQSQSRGNPTVVTPADRLSVQLSPATISDESWFYIDLDSRIQGPFLSTQMSQWFRDGVVNVDLRISQSRCGPFHPYSSHASDPFSRDVRGSHIADQRFNLLKRSFDCDDQLIHTALDKCNGDESKSFDWLLDHATGNSFFGPVPLPAPCPAPKPPATKVASPQLNQEQLHQQSPSSGSSGSSESTMIQVDVKLNGRGLEEGGTVVAATACLKAIPNGKGRSFHITGHQFTLKTAGARGVDTYQCSFCRSCRCKVKLHHNTRTNEVNLHTSDGSPVVHTEKCKAKNGFSCEEIAVDTSGSLGVDVSEEANLKADELATENAGMAATRIWTSIANNFNEKYSNGWCGATRQSVMNRVYYIRRQVFGAGDVFRSAEHANYKNTKDGLSQSFLRYNLSFPCSSDIMKVDRLMVFGHPQLLPLLNGNVDVYIDGTFSSAPKGFAQVLIVMVHDPQTRSFVPVSYILMTSRKAVSYFQAFHFLISDTDFEFTPGTITCDFEPGLVKELRHQFPECKINGCLFHFKQACRRKMLELCIPKDQISVAMERGMLDLLTVVPPSELRTKGIPYVRSILEGRCVMTKLELKKWDVFFRDYFERQWMSPNMLHVWNLHGEDGTVTAIKSRTNNA